MSKKDEPGRSVTFNIGSQQGAISNVAGDQIISGQQSVAVSLPVADLKAELRALLAALDRSALPPDKKQLAAEALTEAQTEVVSERPDGTKVASSLERFTRVARQAGALADAGASLAAPLLKIAGFLGPLGHTLLRLLR